ncbi:hypothetical protein L1987_16261 [Smallanthus sonchifolius]|uniref:Uncharacterized protein n=1 Tax=Smallanthus sonchifolius TaxID=185202 RepID=A0ACB9J8Q0_9ASTR|nr:hypothetical protein L1987_16261 [Smallanthus sonchifolius]
MERYGEELSSPTTRGEDEQVRVEGTFPWTSDSRQKVIASEALVPGELNAGGGTSVSPRKAFQMDPLNNKKDIFYFNSDKGKGSGVAKNGGRSPSRKAHVAGSPVLFRPRKRPRPEDPFGLDELLGSFNVNQRKDAPEVESENRSKEDREFDLNQKAGSEGPPAQPPSADGIGDGSRHWPQSKD